MSYKLFVLNKLFLVKQFRCDCNCIIWLISWFRILICLIFVVWFYVIFRMLLTGFHRHHFDTLVRFEPYIRFEFQTVLHLVLIIWCHIQYHVPKLSPTIKNSRKQFICWMNIAEHQFYMNYRFPSKSILTDKRNATTKNRSCFIQAVISSNYVEINQ